MVKQLSSNVWKLGGAIILALMMAFVFMPGNVHAAAAESKAEQMQQLVEKYESELVGKNESLDNVTKDLKLSRYDTYQYTKVTWSIPEAAKAYLSQSGDNGKVTRPSLSDGDITFDLGMKVEWTDSWDMASYNGWEDDDPEPVEKTYSITIKAYTEEESDQARQDVSEAIAEFDTSTIKTWFDGTVADLGAIDQDLSLPTPTTNGVRTSWTSSNEDVLRVNYARAYPNRDDVGGEAKTTRLTITMSKNGVSSTRAFTVTVIPMTQEEIDGENEYLNAVAGDISFDTIKKDNLNPEKVTTNLQPVYRGYYDAETGEVTYKTSNTGNTGAAITWSYSSNISSGRVTRPSGSEDVEVTCTATVASQRYKDITTPRTVEISIVILGKETTVDLNEAPAIAGDSSESDFVEVNTEYSLELDSLFTDLNGDTLSYKVSVDNAEYTALEGNSYRNTWAETGNHVLQFKANDGKTDSEDVYSVNLEVLNAEDTEAAAALKGYKQEKIAELKDYKNAADYRTAQKKELNAAISAGQDAINAATDKGAVDVALAEAKAEIDKIKTNKELVKEDLKNVIANANEFAGGMSVGPGEGEYPEAAKAALQDAIASAEAVLNNEESSDGDLLAAADTLKAALAEAKDATNPTSISVNILGQDKENAFTKAMYPAKVSSDEASKLGYEKPAEYKHRIVAIDAIAALHKAMYGEAFENAPTDYLVMNKGGLITKIFGKSTQNAGYYVNYEYPTYPDDDALGSVAFDTVLEDGDQFNVWIYGTARHTDKLLYFGNGSYTAETPGKVEVELKSRQAGIVGTAEEKSMAGATVSVIDAEGKEVVTATTDKDGKAGIPAVEPGEYVITVNDIPYDETVKDDHFVAPYSTLSVGALADEVTAEITAAVRNYEEADKFDMIPQKVAVSSHAAESYGDMGDCSYSNGGKVTIADVLYTLHSNKFKEAFSKETAAEYLSISDKGRITKCFNVETSNQVSFINNDLSMTGSAYETTLEDGDIYDLFMNRDGWNDVATCFSEDSVDVGVNEEFELSLMRVNWDGTRSALKPAEGSEIIAATVDKRGYLTQIQGSKMDPEGKVKLLFEEPGTYIVSAKGKADGEYGNGAIAAPHCTVNVKDPLAETKKDAIAEVKAIGEAARNSVANPYEVDIAALKAISDVRDAESVEEVESIVAKVESEIDKMVADKAAADAESAKKLADASKAAASNAAKTPGQAAVNAAKKAQADAESAVAKAQAAKEAADKAVESAQKALDAAQTEDDKAKAQKALDAAKAKAAAADKAKTVAENDAKSAKDNVSRASSAAQKAAASDAKAKKVKTVTVNVKTVNKKAVDKAVKKAGGSNKYVTKIVLGKKVKKIKKNTFKTYRKVSVLEVKTKKLTKKSVKGSLKGSKVKTVKVKVGKSKTNKKYVKKYKKFFTKKNAGKKAKVRR